MNILITGATGFIGSELMKYLINKHLNVYGISSTKTSNRISKISLNNSKLLNSFLSKNNFDVVIHLAALLENNTPLMMFNSNCKTTINLLDNCIKNGIKKFIFSSSHAVYGKSNYLPIDETHPTEPITNYGITKLMSEQIAKMYSMFYDIKILNLRLSSVYGIRQPKERLVPKMILNSIKNKQMKLHKYKNGFQIMDLVHIHDVCKAFELSCKSNISFGTYNIASGSPITIENISNIISKLTSNQIFKIQEIDSEINHFFYDISKAKKDLNFSPKYTIDKHTLSSFIKNFEKK